MAYQAAPLDRWQGGAWWHVSLPSDVFHATCQAGATQHNECPVPHGPAGER